MSLLVLDAASVNKQLKTSTDGLDLVPHHNVDSVAALPVQHIDSFSRVRTSNPGYRFDSQLTYHIDSDLWDQSTSGGTITHSATERTAALSANASGANTAILQSHYHSPYTPGRGQLAFITFTMGAAPATAGFKRVGYFDGTNGIYLERTPTAVNLVCKSSTAHGTETVPQASWNVDPMDGTGPSGLTLNLLNTQILVIALQALYVGRVIVGFDIAGELVPVHQFTCANNEASPYIAQASLPVRYECTSTAGTTSAIAMTAICSSVISEGGKDLQDMSGREFVASGTTANTAAAAAIVIRCKAQLNSINQNAIVVPTEVNVSAADAGCWVEVRRNATVSAGTFEDIDAASTVEVSYAGNAGTDPVVTAGTGTLIDRFYLPASNTQRTAIAAGITGKAVLAYSHLLAAGDTLSIIYNGGGATTDLFASLKWKELR